MAIEKAYARCAGAAAHAEANSKLPTIQDRARERSLQRKENTLFLRFRVKNTEPQGRGRPKTPLIQRLRVIIWSHCVMAASGSISVKKFEDDLEQRSRKVRLSKGLWARYTRGEVLPQGSLMAEGMTLVERIDAIYPRTADVFHSPMWELMDFEKVLGPQELKSMYLQLGKETWSRFVSNHNSSSAEAVAASRYWKKRLSGEELVRNLRALKGFEALSSCLIEARLGYLRQEEAWFIAPMLEGRRIMSVIADTVVFAPPRMQSALFLLEGLWIAHVREQVIAPPIFRDVPLEVMNSAKRWEKQWAEVSRNHGDTLSKSSRAVFERWRTECAPSMPFR